VWNNTVNGVLSLPASSASVVQLGRDFLTTPRPGYTPYVYPHPLVTGMSHVPAPTVMRRVYE
jgi:hypothetical protein